MNNNVIKNKQFDEERALYALSGASVEGEIVKNGKGKKIRIFTYKSKDRSNRRTMGHRQPYTKVEIKKVKA